MTFIPIHENLFPGPPSPIMFSTLILVHAHAPGY